MKQSLPISLPLISWQGDLLTTLLPWICLFWTFYKNAMIQYMGFFVSGISLFFFFFSFFILTQGHAYWLEREREGGRENHQCEKHRSIASHMCCDRGLNLQPRHVSWQGLEPASLQFMGQCSHQLSHTSQGCLFFFQSASYQGSSMLELPSVLNSSFLKWIYWGYIG